MSVKAVAMQLNCMPGVYHPQASHNQTRFGSVGTAMATVFQPISENFVWEFLSQDVVALWIPRIITSLRRGRHPYDPYEDPQLREGKPLQQWFHSIYMNAKGLNWSNAREESYREFETGPGIFLAPSAVLLAAAWLGNKSLQMNNKALYNYANALSDWSPNSKVAPKQLSEAFFKHILETSHLNSLLDSHLNVPTPEGTAKMHDGVKRFVASVLGKGEKEATTSKDALAAWQQLILDPSKRKGLDHVLEGETKYTQGWAHQIGFHSGEADKMSHLFKRMMMAYDIKVQDAIATWTRTWDESFKSGYFKKVKQHNELEAGLNQIVYWANNGKNVETNHLKLKFEEAASTPGVVFDRMNTFRGFIDELTHNGMPTKWTGDINTLLKNTTIWKGVLSIAATIAACATVIIVSAKAQHGRAYPANRNVQFTNLNQPNDISVEMGQPSYTGVTNPTPEWLPLQNSSNPWTNTSSNPWAVLNNNPWSTYPNPYAVTPSANMPWMAGGMA